MLRTVCFGALLLLLVSPVASLATTRHVPSVYPTIQSGIDAAVFGDTVLVACGVYTWTGEGTGSLFRGIVSLKSGVTVRSETGIPGCVTIDGEGLGTVISGEGVNSVSLEGITAKRGVPGLSGGGLNLDGWGIQVRDCVFRENCSDGGIGYAVSCDGDARFERCLFEANGGWQALAHQYGELTLEESGFLNNSSSDGDLIVYDLDPTSTIARCVFDGNPNGGVDCHASNISMGHTTIRSPAGAPEAVYAGFGGYLRVDHCLLVRGDRGAVLRCGAGGGATMSCTNMHDYDPENEEWLEWCVYGQNGVNGNFTADPRFCDPVAGDVSLRSDSPCLPGQHPGGADCDLIGARGLGCSVTTVEPASWGLMKARFTR